jgi:hypothetical protein
MRLAALEGAFQIDMHKLDQQLAAVWGGRCQRHIIVD